jgi:hypothetical protein
MECLPSHDVFFEQNAYGTVLTFYFFLQEVWERTGSELDSMVGDTNLFLSEGGKHAEVSNWHYFSLMKTFLISDSLRLTR